MTYKTVATVIAGGALAAVLIATGQVSQHQGQTWKIKLSDAPGMVHFTVQRSRDGNTWSTSTDVRFANFQGLSRNTIERGGPAKFEYIHDAGRLVCQGDFSWNRGSGTFEFEPDHRYVSELRSLGYETPGEEQIFSMVLTDVSLEFARGVREGGLQASTQQLIDLRVHGVTLDYIRSAAHDGYRSFSAQDYIDLRIHGVTSSYLRDLKAFGYNLNSHDIVELRIHGVSSEFVGELKAAGYDLPSSKIAELGMHGINSDYLRDLKTYGLQPRADDLVQLRIHGVSTAYLKGLKDAGYGGLIASEITDLTIHGVSIDFIRDCKDLGYNFTPQEMIELRVHGVDGGYLRRLRDSGMRNLSASQIEKLRVHGVD
ncbi:MAG TPA: hypothetical protein VKU19_36235 [Bryobacteraceae bacterium]|nr:hypothetical protein [Bryobacteraceae bacterium]